MKKEKGPKNEELKFGLNLMAISGIFEIFIITSILLTSSGMMNTEELNNIIQFGVTMIVLSGIYFLTGIGFLFAGLAQKHPKFKKFIKHVKDFMLLKNIVKKKLKSSKIRKTGK